MKKLIVFIIAICLIPTRLWAGSVQDVISVIARKNVASAGGTDYTQHANCVGAWLFASGSTLVDSSTNSNTLTDNGTVTFTVTGIPLGTGQAAVFNGTTQYFSVASAVLSNDFPGDNDTKTDMTASYWVKKDNVDEFDIHLIKGVELWEVGNTYQAGSLADADELYWESNNGGVEATAEVVSTAWKHVCFVFDGDTPDSTVYLYVSASSFGDEANGTPLTITGQTGIGSDASPFLIGNYSAAYLDGQIFQVAVFNTNLSNTDCQSMFENGLTGAD